MINVAVDIETTGLDARKHDIVELAVVQFDDNFNEVDGLKFISKIKPNNIHTVSDKAMSVNKLSLSELDKAPTTQQVRSMFLEWKYELFGDEQFYVLGHNYDAFDKIFLLQWLGDLYNDIFHYRTRDTMKAASFIRDAKKKIIKNLSLASLASMYNINKGHLHSAYVDASTCIEVYKCLLNEIA